MSKLNPLSGKGAQMRHIRESRKLSDQDVAYAMGCSTAELQQMEGGTIEQGSTYLAKLYKWSEVVGYPIGLFLEGEWSPCDDQILFLQKCKDVSENALERLAQFEPAPSLKEAIGVCRLIREKFEKYWDEQRTEVVAWRAPEFSVDEFELRKMLHRVKMLSAPKQ